MSWWPGLTVCPRCMTDIFHHSHFLTSNAIPPHCRTRRAASTSYVRFYTLVQYMMTPSRYTRQGCHVHRLRTISKVRWKMAGALINPNGMRLKRYVPASDVNVVLSLFSSWTGIGQYHQLASDGEQMHASSKESTNLSIRGGGYVSLRDIALSFFDNQRRMVGPYRVSRRKQRPQPFHIELVY